MKKILILPFAAFAFLFFSCGEKEKKAIPLFTENFPKAKAIRFISSM
jgi:hypothetical protein